MACFPLHAVLFLAVYFYEKLLWCAVLFKMAGRPLAYFLFMQNKRKHPSRIYFILNCLCISVCNSALVLHVHSFFSSSINLQNHPYSRKIRIKIKGEIVIVTIFYVFLYHLHWELELVRFRHKDHTGMSHLCQHSTKRPNWVSSLSPKASSRVWICCFSDSPPLYFLYFL